MVCDQIQLLFRCCFVNWRNNQNQHLSSFIVTQRKGHLQNDYELVHSATLFRIVVSSLPKTHIITKKRKPKNKNKAENNIFLLVKSHPAPAIMLSCEITSSSCYYAFSGGNIIFNSTGCVEYTLACLEKSKIWRSHLVLAVSSFKPIDF